MEEKVNHSSVELIAVLDHADNVKDAGFYLWRDAHEKNRQEAALSGNTLCVFYDGLEAETEYQYAVFFSNGQTEQTSETYRFITAELPMPVVESVSVEPGIYEAVVSVRFSGTEFLHSCSAFYRTVDFGQWVEVPLDAGEEGYSCMLASLEAETDYEFCLSYSNGKRTIEAESSFFRTLQAPDPDPEPEPEPEPDPKPLSPDAFDPVLLDYLLGHFDEDSDGVLTDVELSKVKELDISDLLLGSQAGLELLPALETLITGDNWLARFDLSANKHLKSFTGGRSPHLQELILDNPELIQTYIVGAPNLRSLDFTRCPHLYVSQWYDIGLESVDLSECQDLYHLDISDTKLKELDLSACRRLKILVSESNPDLNTIWLKEGIVLDTCEVDPHTQIKYK